MENRTFDRKNDQFMRVLSTEDHATIRSLVDSKIDVNQDVRRLLLYDTTPLIEACTFAKDVETIRLLVDLKADVNKRSAHRQRTPLSVTVDGFLRGSDDERTHEILKILIEAKANVNQRDENRIPILMCHMSCRAMKMLIEARACIDLQDEHGETCLDRLKALARVSYRRTSVEQKITLVSTEKTFLLVKETLPFPIHGGHYLLGRWIVEYTLI